MKNALRLARAQNNMTQQELADKIGVSRQTINSIETGRYVPSTVLALKLAKMLSSQVEALFQIEESD
jgi:putative transcriptional regulator